MRAMVLAAIVVYQRYLSPLKGFACAYRVHTGRQSCSALGFRAVRRYGAVKGLRVLRRRLYLCGVAYRRHAPVRSAMPFQRQAGFCDAGCDVPCDFSFDLPGIDVCSSFGDCGSCDWPSRRKKDEQERYVHIPPKKRSSGSHHDAS